MAIKKTPEGKGVVKDKVLASDILKSADAKKAVLDIKKLLNENRVVQENIIQLMAKKDFLSRVRSARSQFETDPPGVNLLRDQGYLMGALFQTVWSRVRNERTRIYKDIDELRKFYLANVLITQFATDALTPEVGTEEVLEVISVDKDSMVAEELARLQGEYDLDAIVNSIKEDFLAYGEYYLSVEVDGTADAPGKGLVGLRDDVEQNTIISLAEFGKVMSYLRVVKRGIGQTEKLELADKNTYIQFSFDPGRLRIDLMKEMEPHIARIKKLEKDFNTKIPRFVRIGKPILFDVIDKISELSLLEQLVPAIQLSNLASGNVVGLSVPANMDPEEAIKLCTALEELVNRKVSVNVDHKAISLENVMSSAGRVKLIPIWGEKTSPVTALSYRNTNESDMSKWAKDVREVVCGAAGIPVEVIFGGTTTSDKGAKVDLLRRYARYLRKLKAVQTAIAKGVLQIAGVHLVAKGIPFQEDKVKVRFKNNLIEIDNLDELEYIDTTIGVLKNVIAFLKVDMKEHVDQVRLAEYVKGELSVAGVPPEVFLDIAREIVVAELGTTDPKTPIKLMS